jgi:hypothetical protein
MKAKSIDEPRRGKPNNNRFTDPVMNPYLTGAAWFFTSRDLNVPPLLF